MSAFCIILSVLFAMLYLRERAANRNLNRELLYVKDRLDIVGAAEENEYILIPSENMGVRELAAQLNRLLENVYLQKADCRKAKRAMEQVLTNISHDLRTPLTVLKGYSELLMRESREESERSAIRNMAEKIDQKADELVTTINAYFTMAKIESGDMKIELRKANITQLCHDVILDYYDILEREQYEVDIRTGNTPVYAWADVDALAGS